MYEGNMCCDYYCNGILYLLFFLSLSLFCLQIVFRHSFNQVLRDTTSVKMVYKQKKTTVVVDKISLFVQKQIIPIIEEHTLPLPNNISFLVSEEDTCKNALSIVKSECPELLHEKEFFISKLISTYDRWYDTKTHTTTTSNT